MRVIECPHCKRQYTIQEIYMPNYLLGYAKDIVRNSDGVIEAFDGVEQDLHEQFTCEECNTTFKVKANIEFETEIVEDESFNDDYSTTIYKDRIKLEE